MEAFAQSICGLWSFSQGNPKTMGDEWEGAINNLTDSQWLPESTRLCSASRWPVSIYQVLSQCQELSKFQFEFQAGQLTRKQQNSHLCQSQVGRNDSCWGVISWLRSDIAYLCTPFHFWQDWAKHKPPWPQLMAHTIRGRRRKCGQRSFHTPWCGDLNIHIDNPSSPLAAEYIEILDCLNLTQDVDAPTHTRGHTLDLVISDFVAIYNLLVYDLGVYDHSITYMEVPCLCQFPSPNVIFISTKR